MAKGQLNEVTAADKLEQFRQLVLAVQLLKIDGRSHTKTLSLCVCVSVCVCVCVCVCDLC